MIRKQYHLRPTSDGFDAWDVEGLIEKSRDFPILEINLEDIRELDEPFWYQSTNPPTVRSVAEHSQLINQASLDFPIILADDGKVMDGMHRVAKAVLQGLGTIKAVRFPKTPDPDFRDVQENELPY